MNCANNCLKESQKKNLFEICLEKCQCKFKENLNENENDVLFMRTKNVNLIDGFLFNNYVLISFFIFLISLYLKLTKRKSEEKDYKRKLVYKSDNIDNDYTEILLDK